MDSEPPFTTEELTETELGRLDIEDQLRYGIYNGHHRFGDLVDFSAFSREWTEDIIDDMVDEGNLERRTDKDGPFLKIPDADLPGLDPEERADIMETAYEEYREASTVGDSEDLAASDDDPDEAYASATDTMSTSEPDAETVETPDTAVDEPPAWYKEMAKHEEDLPHDLPAWDDIKASMGDHGGLLPVNRSYDWDAEKLDPESVPEFIQADHEQDDIADEIEDRRETGKLPHFCISGPTGCGKTTLGERFGVDMDAPVFEIHCHEGLRPSNLLGMPTYIGDEVWWIDGPLPKALQASNDRPVVVILDEVNRTSSRTLGVMMSFLDHQAKVTLNARGGETVEGNPMNLIVFSTMNEGEGYVVNAVDTAQQRRLGNKFYTDYIGMTDLDAEADLIADRTPIDDDVAAMMVETANEIRRKAQDDGAVSMGVPTSTMLDWARTAWTYHKRDRHDDPLVKAGERSVVNPFFRGDSTEEDTVVTTIESHLKDHPVVTGEDEEDDEMAASSESGGGEISVSDESYLVCESCGWYETAGDAPDDVATKLSCPKCDANVVPKDSSA